MMARHDDISNDDWTPDERELFASLPRERTPPSELRVRTFNAVWGRPHRVGGRVTAHAMASARPYALAIAAAAAAVVFLAGTLVGFAMARRSAPINSTSRSTAHEAVATGPGKRDTTTNQLRLVVWY